MGCWGGGGLREWGNEGKWWGTPWTGHQFIKGQNVQRCRLKHANSKCDRCQSTKWFPIHLAHGIKKTQPSRERHSGVLSEAAVNTSLRESKSIEGSVNDSQCKSVRVRNLWL